MNSLVIPALALAWLAILAGAWLVWQLLGQNGRLLLRVEALEQRLNGIEFGEQDAPEGLPFGTEAPAFELPDLAGERKSLSQFRGQRVLLVFFNPGCGFCREMTPILKEKVESRKQKPENAGAWNPPVIVVISAGDAQANRQWCAEHKVSCPVLLQKDGEVAKAYQALGTPSAYLISPEGRIASKLAMGAEALLALLDRKAENRKQKAEMAVGNGNGNGKARADRFRNRSLAKSRINRDGLKAGTPAPDFRLPRLDGHGDLALADLKGNRVLLVFSSPHCGPCNTLAPELEKFHRENPELHVVMISRGEPKENRAKVKEHGLTFPVVLQQQWEISRRYAMFATPIAYLIDEQGVITNDAAVGTEAIMHLMAVTARSQETMLSVAGL